MLIETVRPHKKRNVRITGRKVASYVNSMQMRILSHTLAEKVLSEAFNDFCCFFLNITRVIVLSILKVSSKKQ